MTKIYLVVRHPRHHRLLGIWQVSKFYEIVKTMPNRKSAKEFCDDKNKNPNTKYHYAVKGLEV